MTKRILFTLTLLLPVVGWAQNVAELTHLFETAPHDSIRLRVSLSLFTALLGKDDRKAMEVSIKALEYIKSSPNTYQRIKAVQNAAERYWENGEYWKAIALERKAIRLAQEINHHYLIGFSFHSIGLNHYYMASYDSALHYYDLAKKEMIQAKDSVYVSRLENHIGLVYDQLGDYSKAVDQIILSMKMQEKLPGYISGAYALNSTESMDDSVFYFVRIHKNRKDLKYEITKEDNYKIAQTYRNIAQDFMALKKYDTAVSYFNRATKYYLKAQVDPFYADLGEAYEALRKYDSADFFMQKKLQLVKDHGLLIHESRCVSSLSRLKLKQGLVNEALMYILESLRLSELMGNRYSIITDKLKLSEIYLKLNQSELALVHVKEALNLAIEIKALPQQAKVYEALQKIYSGRGQFREAFEAMSIGNELNKKLSEGNVRLQTARQSFRYERELKDAELKDMKEAAQLQEAKINNRNLLIILATTLVLVAVLFGVLFYLRFKQKKRLSELLERQNKVIETQNQELMTQNKEKEVLLSEIHHRVKNNLQIISSLINLKSNNSSHETFEVLQQLNGRIYSMGLIHEKLYQKEDIRLLRLDLYLAELSQYLVQSFSENNDPVELELSVEPIELDVDKTLACGLICNEVITNSLKHAFQEDQRNRKIAIHLHNVNNKANWVIQDNGSKKAMAILSNSKSFGLRFVDQLVKSKLAGSWFIKSDNGATTSIQFSL